MIVKQDKLFIQLEISSHHLEELKKKKKAEALMTCFDGSNVLVEGLI